MITEEQLREIEVLSFDCYGTLIDWETGILDAWRPMAAARHIEVSDAKLLEIYADLEATVERGPYKSYRQVLSAVTDGLGGQLYFVPTPAERGQLAVSLPLWKPFPDTVTALQKLSKRFKLDVISNVDSELFAGTEAAL